MKSYVKMEFDARHAFADLNSIEKDQFPFAYVVSLTRLAEGGAASVRVVTKAMFNLHNNFIPNNITIEPALKKDFNRFGYATAAVKTNERISFMSLQETGEQKTPRKTALAIPDPTRQGTGMSLKTGTGAIKADLRPAYLLANKKQLGVFINPKDGVLYLRMPDHHLLGLYLMTGAKKIRPKWKFEKTVDSFVHLKDEQIFYEELDIALRGANIPGKVNIKAVRKFEAGISRGFGIAFG